MRVKQNFCSWFCSTVLILISSLLPAQKVYVNTFNDLYELEPGNVCQNTSVSYTCATNPDGRIFSSALHNDTLYFVAGSSNAIYRKRLPAGGCALLTTFPFTGSWAGVSMNSMTVSKTGIIYLIDYNTIELHEYNPYTDVKRLVGTLPQRPAGDLMFYNDKLLYSAEGGVIYEINMGNTPASTVFMNTPGYNFFGLISFPFNCNENKIYGLSPAPTGTELVELNLVDRIVVGPVCTLPLAVYDAASNVENGNTTGVSLESIRIQPPCDPSANTGTVTFAGHTAAEGQLTYTLDNNTTNHTGEFANVDIGPHTIHIENGLGCSQDSFFTMTRGLDPNFILNKVQPLTCPENNGAVAVTAASPFLPLQYSLNNGPFQHSNQFINLTGGIYTLTVRDAANCQHDTTFLLSYVNRPSFINNLVVEPALCKSNTGQIRISSGIPGVTAGLNNNPPGTSLSFTGLSAGEYVVSVYTPDNCRHDTLVNVPEIKDNAPDISITKKDQRCFINNGEIQLAAAGTGAPFLFSINNSAFIPQSLYTDLEPGIYAITVRNAHFCSWDTIAEILSYPLLPVTTVLKIEKPTCTELTTGSITATITGPENPYTVLFNNRSFANGHVFNNLESGDYELMILNKDGCRIDSTVVHLMPDWEPACDAIHMPSAFTPNADGRNDIFAPVFSPYITPVSFRIFNRYGQLVFQGNGRNGWDGKVAGYEQPSGVYVWTLSYRLADNQQKFAKGHLVLIR